MHQRALSTLDVARMAGIHRDTLLRWLRCGAIPEPSRDRHGWRVFSEEQARQVVDYSRSGAERLGFRENETAPYAYEDDPQIVRLKSINWDFVDARTNYLTHGIHPYPAKYIPQIPNALIQELSSVGETVGDIFCGSGTTLVEALLLKRNAVGVDANPLGSLITQAKTAIVSTEDLSELRALAAACKALVEQAAAGEGDLFYGGLSFKSDGWRPSKEITDFWFERHVVEELAELLKRVRQLNSPVARMLAEVAFSAIVVAVSKQDSDTRYVRREKAISRGFTIQRFCQQVEFVTRAAEEFSEVVEPRFWRQVVCANVLSRPATERFHLMVCSPPYPNAYSYHLYHRFRLLWLRMDAGRLKRDEIGSHRKYSSKGPSKANEATFRQELAEILAWLRERLYDGRHACFVVGDSTLDGRRIDNSALLIREGERLGFREQATIVRNLQSTRKAFNPEIGKIKQEKIVILRKV